eukprot:Nitzschia sp. Nitz4//scaffold47_size129522//19136//20601//NITZ4_003538-RA/size129522-snap-gene-0.181-mRNA-1//1//CDS//3329552761//8808//frame0
MKSWAFLLLFLGSVLAEEQTCAADGTCAASLEDDPACVDNNDSCKSWATQGECDANPNYMLVQCMKSCFVCGEDVTTGLPEDGSDLGVPQHFPNPKTQLGELTALRLPRTRRYMKDTKVNDSVKKLCVNQHEKCMEWASQGECKSNELYMQKYCAPACFSCEYLAIEQKCPMDLENRPNIWGPGDLDTMFERLTAEPYLSQYNVQVLSSPKTDGPWILQFENVLSREEADQMIELGSIQGYQRSADVGIIKADGKHDRKISTGRTSTNAWCLDDCYRNETTQAIIHRLEEFTGIPDTNSEYLQLLRYEPSQFYESHHDYIGHHTMRQCGVRILTFFLYLNDVEEGGGTNFDRLNLTVTPKVGRAVLWPSVLSDSPSERDDRTHHQALPVERGVKFGANAWIHLRDFKEPYHNHCI